MPAVLLIHLIYIVIAVSLELADCGNDGKHSHSTTPPKFRGMP